MEHTKTKLDLQIHHVTMMNAVQTFLRIAMAGKSPETKRWYSLRLNAMSHGLGEERLLLDILEVDLLTYREALEKRKITPDTLHGHLRAMRRFFKWLYQRGMIAANISTDIHLPQLPRRGKKGISDKHAELILEAAKQNSPRDYAMLRFFASTSARRGGVCTLRLSDLSLDAPEPFCRQVQVYEKRKKERTVFMDKETFEAMKEWLKVRPDGSQYVFVTQDGKPLALSSISEVIDRYKARLGIKEPCSPHQWRHRWFRRVLQNHMPIGQAAQIGGHQNIKITYEYYGQYAMHELQESFDRYYDPK
jgi:site-specific recombinase XerD